MQAEPTNQNNSTAAKQTGSESASTSEGTKSVESTNRKVKRNTTKKSTTLYEYLHETGVLESGDENLIAKVKAAYWRNYHKQYKRVKRSSGMECTVVLSSEEQQLLAEKSREHNESIPLLLKQMALAYLKQHYISPDKRILQAIEQKLSAMYTKLEQLVEESTADITMEINTQHNPTTVQEINKMLRHIESIECILQEMEISPKTLEMEIAKVLDQNPNYLSELIQKRNTYDYQITSKKIN